MAAGTLNLNNTPTSNTTNNNNSVISSTSHPQQNLPSPHHALHQFGRVDLSPSSSSHHGEAGGVGVGATTTTAPVAVAPKRELNIRSWFSSSSMASSSSPPVTGDLLNIEGSQPGQQQQRPNSPLTSGMTPPAPSKDQNLFLFSSCHC